MKTFTERFRRRISLVVAVIFMVLVVATHTPYQQSLAYELLILPGILLVTIGVLGRLWCTTYIGGRKNQELITDGPYSLWRNPLYVFSFIGLLGVVVSTRLLSLLFLAIPAFLFYYRFVIRSEERRLEELFGETFRQYCERVKVVCPALGNYWSRPSFDMNPTYYQRAMADAAMFILSLLAMEAIHRLKVLGVLRTCLELPF